MDLLSDLFLQLRPRCANYFPSEMAAPWGFAAPGGPVTYHVAVEGTCQLEVDAPDGPEVVTLQAGDVALAPTGAACTFRSAPDVWAPPLSSLGSSVGSDGVLRRAGRGPVTKLVCGTLVFDDALPNPLLDTLPPLIVVRSESLGDASWLKSTLASMAHESRSTAAGARAATSYLACVLFVQVLRRYLEQDASCRPGLFRALRDSHLTASLTAFHEAPAADWTVDALAAEAGLSRSAYAERFHEAVGMPPMTYARAWRMHEAARLLRADDATLDAVAEQVGYGSAAAFGRSFKSVTGTSPGAYRQNTRA